MNEKHTGNSTNPNIANRLIEEVMPMVEISEKNGEYMPVCTITGTLRVYKEDN